MNSKFSKWSVVPAAVLLLGTVAMAQDSSSSVLLHTRFKHDSHPGSNGRTAQGKSTGPHCTRRESGQLTAGETSNLETKEAAINGETRADRAANGGKLTAAEKQQINGQQNKLSNQIYNDKHNANTAHYGNNAVGQRRENQQDRIAQGVKSGQLTAGETAKLENQQKGINRQVAADRAANGGKLTAGEKKQVNGEQNARFEKHLQ